MKDCWRVVRGLHSSLSQSLRGLGRHKGAGFALANEESAQGRARQRGGAASAPGATLLLWGATSVMYSDVFAGRAVRGAQHNSGIPGYKGQ